MEKKQKKAGKRLILECKAQGYPNPAVTWYKDDESVTQNSNITYEAHSIVISQLWIEKTVVEDSGVYFCKAENIHGTETKSVEVTVISELNI